MSQRGIEVNEQNQSQPENSENEVPQQLRFMDQTPMPSNMRSDNERTRTELSPPSEDIIEENITNQIGTIVEKTVSQIVPKYFRICRARYNSWSNRWYTKKQKLKQQFMEEVQQQIEGSRHDEHLKMISEYELLESYNRRDNIRIIVLNEMIKTDNQNRIIHESVDEITDKVVELSDACGAKVNANDLWIAHRLPSKKPGERPVNVRFARRAGKLQLLRNKKALSNKMGYENVRVFESSILQYIEDWFQSSFSLDTRKHNLLCWKKTVESLLLEDFTKVAVSYNTIRMLWWRVSTQEISSNHLLTHRM